MPEDDFAKELEKSFNEAANNEGEHTPEKPSEEPSKSPEPPKEGEEKQEVKEEATPEGESKEQEIVAGEEEKAQSDAPEEKKAEEPVPQEQPTALTKDDFKSIINELRNEERSTGKELEETTKTVIEAYYPKGLSRTLVDETTGKELKTPQDVVDASGGTMDIQEATQWLMNEQFKLDKSISEIENNAKQIAEQTIKFKRDGEAVLSKYEPLFKAYPQVQKKVFDQYMKLVNYDKDKDVVLSAPDMEEFYDMVLDPYRLAFEYSQNKPATEPEKPAEPPKPTKDDRLDVSGDGEPSEIDDPNDFAAQVRKELSRKD